MAKDIPTIERQIFTPNIQIKPNQAFATMGEATSEIGNLLTQTLENQSTYYSGLAGEQHAAEGRAPKNLLPPLTKATAAYNQAVVNTETRSLTLQGKEALLKAYAEQSDPSTFTKDTPANFAAIASGIIEGTLEGTRPENRVQVKDALTEAAGLAKVRMLDNAIAYDNKQKVLLFQRELLQAQEQLSDARLSKDPEAIAAAQGLVEQIFNDYGEISQPIKDSIPDLRKKIETQSKIDDVVAGYIEAYRSGNEVKFLDQLTKTKPDNLTQTEYFAALQEVLKYEKTFQSAENKYNTEQYYKAHYEIVSGQITTLEELKRQYGNSVPASSFFSLSETLLAQKKEQESVYTVESTRYFGANEVAKLPSKTLNDYYAEKEKQILNQVNSNLPEGSEPIQRLNLSQRAEAIVLPAGAPIPDFLVDLSYGLKSTNPATATDALNAYRLLFRNQGAFGDTLKGLDSDADDIAQYVLSIGDVSEADTLNLIQTAQNNINDKSDTTMVARRERLQKLYAVKDGLNVIQSTYKGAYDVLPDNANTDAHYGTFQKLFDNYFMGVANGSETVALSMTMNALRDWGKSRFSEPNKIMYAPPDIAIPFADNGYWMDNQVGEALNGLLTKHEEAQTGIARPKWMAELPITNETTDQQMMDTNYYPKRTALINGIEREIYIQSTKNTRTSEFPGEIYQFYYLDDYGVMQYIVDPNNPLAVANWLAMEMAEYVPNVFNNLKEESFDEMAFKIYEREGTGKADVENSNQYLPFFIDGEDVETGRRLLHKKGKLDNEEIDIIKERLHNIGKKKIVFKDGKPVELDDAAVAAPQTKTQPPAPTPKAKPGTEIDLDDIGRRKGNVVPSTGRPLIQNEDGSVSSELSITITDPRINKGKPTNIPSIWDGEKLSDEEAIERAISSGKKFESFKTIEDAVEAAVKRSKKLDEEISKGKK